MLVYLPRRWFFATLRQSIPRTLLPFDEVQAILWQGAVAAFAGSFAGRGRPGDDGRLPGRTARGCHPAAARAAAAAAGTALAVSGIAAGAPADQRRCRTANVRDSFNFTGGCCMDSCSG